jgi:hypothetical protein
MYGLSLQWKKCPDGVEQFDRGPDPSWDLKSASPDPSIWFRFRSAKREMVRHDISNLESPIIVRFLNAKDDGAIAAFFFQFGMLYEEATKSGEFSKDQTESNQKALKKVLESAGSGDVMSSISFVNKALSASVADDHVPVLDLADNAKLPRLAWRAKNLFGLMIMETVLVATSGARFASCEHCGNVILTGPLTGRRSTARFCSDRCRVAAMRARNEKAR